MSVIIEKASRKNLGGVSMVKKILLVFLLSFSIVIPFTAAAKQVGGGDMTFTPKKALPVVFSHELHVNSKGLKCTGCHYRMYQITQGSYKMDMNKLTKDAFCEKCHNGQKSFAVKETKNCGRCHK